jgi:hypothetical protein
VNAPTERGDGERVTGIEPAIISLGTRCPESPRMPGVTCQARISLKSGHRCRQVPQATDSIRRIGHARGTRLGRVTRMVEQVLVDRGARVGCRTRRSATAVEGRPAVAGSQHPHQGAGTARRTRRDHTGRSARCWRSTRRRPHRPAPQKSRPSHLDIADSNLAEYAGYFGCDLKDDSCPPGVRSLWRSICRWLDQTSGGTDCPFRTGRRRRYISHQFLKRIGFRLRFAHYRIRAFALRRPTRKGPRDRHTQMSSAEPSFCAANGAFGYRLRLLHELAEKVLGLYPDPVSAS